MEASREPEYSTIATLYVALELSQKEWKLAFSTGAGQAPRQRTLPAKDIGALEKELAWAKVKFGLPPEAPVVSCYEAGLDGFWIHRCLLAHGVANSVVESASIEVSRRAKHAKTDRLDAQKLVQMLMRYAQGEAHVWHVVRVPSVAEEDARHLHRELLTLKHDRTRCRNRITGVLTTHGVQLQPNTRFLAELAAARQWDEQPLPPGVVQRVSSEYAHLQFIEGQIKTLDAQRETLLATSLEPAIAKMRQLMQLRGVGINGAWLLVLEFYGWREFKNRRELGALAGLVPTPHQSGDSHREQGISKAGNRPVRGMMIELAWCWLRYQPESELAQWFERRYGAGGKRARRIGIVAVARRLLVALWRYLESGEIPTGAQLKPTG